MTHALDHFLTFHVIPLQKLLLLHPWFRKNSTDGIWWQVSSVTVSTYCGLIVLIEPSVWITGRDLDVAKLNAKTVDWASKKGPLSRTSRRNIGKFVDPGTPKAKSLSP